MTAKQKQEDQLRQRERELTALKGALKEEVASHDKELDRVRQQYQQDMEQLRRNMEDVSQVSGLVCLILQVEDPPIRMKESRPTSG